MIGNPRESDDTGPLQILGYVSWPSWILVGLIHVENLYDTDWTNKFDLLETSPQRDDISEMSRV